MSTIQTIDVKLIVFFFICCQPRQKVKNGGMSNTRKSANCPIKTTS